jgi:hypothetical protein
VSDKEKPSRQKVPLWAWMIGILVVAATFFTRMTG